MFKVNDVVMYGSTGVCRVANIVKEKESGEETAYYILHPLDSNSLTIKTPVGNPRVNMRPLMTKNEVLSLIAAMPEQKTIEIEDKRERSNHFKTVLKSGDNGALIQVIKTLYLEKEEKTVANKKLSKTDEEIMKTAEKHLYEEFAIALNISPGEVLTYILDHLSHHQTQRAGK